MKARIKGSSVRCGYPPSEQIVGNGQVVDAPPRTTLSDGTQVYPEHRDILKDGPRAGQQKGYVVLAEEERAKGYMRPFRTAYKHLKCGVTTMGDTIAATYARDPFFYSGTFCCHCGTHFPVGEDGEFVWQGTNEKVGT